MDVKAPAPFEPRNDVERFICTALEQFTTGEVFVLQTLEEYRANKLSHDLIGDDFDYIARTGVRWSFNGMLRAGETVGVKLVEHEIALNVLERWMT